MRKATAGRVRIRLYPGAVKGDERDMVRLLRRGRLEGAALTGVGLGLIAPLVRVLDLPFLFRNDRELSAARRAITPRVKRAFGKRGVVLLAWAAVGWINFYSQKKVRTRADLRQLRVWSWVDDPLAAKTLAALGLRVVRLGVPDVLPALQAGLIDSVYGSAYTTLSLQWHTHLRYRLPLRVTHSSAAVVLSKRVMARLAPADRKLLLREGRRFQRRHLAQSRKDNAQALAQLRRMGIKPARLDPGLVRRLEQRVAAMRQKLAGKLFPADVLALVLRARGR